MPQEASPVAVIIRRIQEMEQQGAQLSQQAAQLQLQAEVLRGLLTGPPESWSSTPSVGPAEAIRTALRGLEGQATRQQVIQAALPIVSTPREKAVKTLDQTIRNLQARGEIVEVEGGQLLLAAP